jgi:hypothetical protein
MNSDTNDDDVSVFYVTAAGQNITTTITGVAAHVDLGKMERANDMVAVINFDRVTRRRL